MSITWVTTASYHGIAIIQRAVYAASRDGHRRRAAAHAPHDGHQSSGRVLHHQARSVTDTDTDDIRLALTDGGVQVRGRVISYIPLPADFRVELSLDSNHQTDAFAVPVQAVVVTLVSNDATTEIVLPYPPKGYGGHELVVSPDEDYVALYLFSGQSEQGWELFSLHPELHHVGGLPYVDGVGDAPQFSPDGQWLGMFVSTTPRVHATGAYFEDISDMDADDSVIVDWARLYVHRVADGVTTSHPVAALVPRALEPDEVNGWTTYGAMRFATATAIELTTPWGERIASSLPITALPSATYPLLTPRSR